MIPIHQNLNGSVAVITGGTGVLCSAMAKELSRHGVKLALLSINATSETPLTKEIEAQGGDVISIKADVLNKQSLIEAKEKIVEKYGRIDFLINGAGGNHPNAITDPETFDPKHDGKSFFDLDVNGFSSVFDLNFMGTFLACQVFGEELLNADYPAIINISSMSSYSPLTKVPAYSAAKAAVNNFTMWMATHFAETKLRVNAIAPGFFVTTQNKDLLMDENGNYTPRSKKIIAATPMKKFGEPKDLVGAILFLLDPSYSSFITGTVLPIDGGYMAYSGV